MRDIDTGAIRLADIPAALGLLTRLPVRVDPAQATARGARAAWAYPLVGLAVAILALVAQALAGWLGWPVTLAAAVALAVQIVVTGAMHEDGLADCADGFWGGWDVARRLEIMKDSHIGTYGVLALGLSLLARWAALTVLLQHGCLVGVVIAAMASRAGMVAVMAALPHARPGGLARQVGRPRRDTALVVAGLALAATLLLWPGSLFAVLLATAATATGAAWLARRKIGGQTGDVLGATQQVIEIAVLAVLAGLVG